jgi:hypothetical protein
MVPPRTDPDLHGKTRAPRRRRPRAALETGAGAFFQAAWRIMGRGNFSRNWEKSNTFKKGRRSDDRPPWGDQRQLFRSIRDKLLSLGDDVAIISGHGPTTTIGRERAANPFLQQTAVAAR